MVLGASGVLLPIEPLLCGSALEVESAGSTVSASFFCTFLADGFFPFFPISELPRWMLELKSLLILDLLGSIVLSRLFLSLVPSSVELALPIRPSRCLAALAILSILFVRSGTSITFLRPFPIISLKCFVQ